MSIICCLVIVVKSLRPYQTLTSPFSLSSSYVNPALPVNRAAGLVIRTFAPLRSTLCPSAALFHAVPCAVRASRAAHETVSEYRLSSYSIGMEMHHSMYGMERGKVHAQSIGQYLAQNSGGSGPPWVPQKPRFPPATSRDTGDRATGRCHSRDRDTWHCHSAPWHGTCRVMQVPCQAWYLHTICIHHAGMVLAYRIRWHNTCIYIPWHSTCIHIHWHDTC